MRFVLVRRPHQEPQARCGSDEVLHQRDDCNNLPACVKVLATEEIQCSHASLFSALFQLRSSLDKLQTSNAVAAMSEERKIFEHYDGTRWL